MMKAMDEIWEGERSVLLAALGGVDELCGMDVICEVRADELAAVGFMALVVGMATDEEAEKLVRIGSASLEDGRVSIGESGSG